MGRAPRPVEAVSFGLRARFRLGEDGAAVRVATEGGLVVSARGLFLHFLIGFVALVGVAGLLNVSPWRSEARLAAAWE